MKLWRPRLFIGLFLGLALLGLLAWGLYLYSLPPHVKLLRDSTVQRGLLFCEQGEEKLLLDFYPGEKGAGLVIYIHGGGWRKGSRELIPPMAGMVRDMRKTGLNVASIDYRMAPRYKMFQMMSDVNCAIDYLRRRGHELGFDPQRIGLLGGSAGGHLALLATGRRKATGLSTIQAVVALYAPTNLTRPDQLWLVQPADFHEQVMKEMFDTPDEARLQRASPLFYAEYLDAPSLLVYGDRDQVVGPGQGMDLYWRLRLLGQPTEFLLVRDSGHLIPLSEQTSPDWYQLSEKVSAFFARTLAAEQ